MKYICCYSGGKSSALAAIETVRKYGRENVILLNHNISNKYESMDIKRFKEDVACYLDIPITYANMDGFEEKGPLEICIELGAFQFEPGKKLCTFKLKTEPFKNYLNTYWSSKPFEPRDDVTIIYGFDKHETDRIQRRIGVLLAMGFKCSFPLAYGERTIECTEEIGIPRPSTYEIYRHANCFGCLKAGRQNWYITFFFHPEIFEAAKQAEAKLGHSILKNIYLEELEYKFKSMRRMGIIPTEKTSFTNFWANVNKHLPEQISIFPCECSI